jgi:AbrB family looped-hinge helix DNA binding protein
MKAQESFETEIRERGQLTIPKKIREMSHMEEGQVVSIVPVGDAIIISPKRLQLGEARNQIKKILKATGLSSDEVLSGLDEERAALFGELYGKKSR